MAVTVPVGDGAP